MKYEHGFTLIEAMITLVVLSTGVLALFNLQIVATQVSIQSNKLMKAKTITQDTIEALMTVEFDHARLSDPTEPGVFTTYTLSEATLNFDPPAGINVQWDVDDNTDGTKLINVTTTWQSSGNQKSISLPLRRSPF